VSDFQTNGFVEHVNHCRYILAAVQGRHIKNSLKFLTSNTLK